VRRRARSLILAILLAASALLAPAAPALAAAPAPAPSATAAAADRAASQPVFRFWSAKFDNAHFYTANVAEAQKLHAGDPNWTYEGQDFRVWPVSGSGCPANTVAVHRFWSSKFESHFYTTNGAEAQKVRSTDKNWSYEGTAFCTAPSASAGTVPVHRFWSAKFGKHFYTANGAEAQKLRSSDRNWAYEGVAMYAPASGPSVPDLRAPKPPLADGWNCPAGYPIKGNQSSSGEWIYHVPGGEFYDRTNPEECFATQQDARDAGYRASKR
jgi:hypothetical protein